MKAAFFSPQVGPQWYLRRVAGLISCVKCPHEELLAHSLTFLRWVQPWMFHLAFIYSHIYYRHISTSMSLCIPSTDTPAPTPFRANLTPSLTHLVSLYGPHLRPLHPPAPALLQAHRCPCFENNEKNLRPSLLLHLLSPNPSPPQISGFPPPALAWGRCLLCLLLYRRVSLFSLTVSVMWQSIQ